MPKVDGKHFAYTQAGKKAAKKYARRKGKNYSMDAIKIAKEMYG